MLFYIASADGIESLVSTEGGAQQDRFVGGSQTLALRLAESLDVRLGHPVTPDRVERRRRRGRGRPGRRGAVVAIPPVLAGADPLRCRRCPRCATSSPSAPPQGAVIKCHAVYDEPFWRADGLTGQAGTDAGPAKVIFDNSPPDGSPGVLLAFLEGGAARELGTWRPEDRRAAVLGTLARLFGPRAAKPEAFYEQKWADEEWTRGCYGCYLPPGAWTAFGRALRPPIGALHWAGAEYARSLERVHGRSRALGRRSRGGHLAVPHRLALLRAGKVVDMTTIETNTRRLAGTELFPIGLGGMPLALSGRPPEEQAIRTIHAALDAGVNLIDTADAYAQGRERGRPQRAADRQGAAGPLRRGDRRHQGRSHPARRRVGDRRSP